MSQPNPSTALARVVLDEMARHGVAFVVLCPGSRSGALAIAAIDSDVSTRVVIDERSAAFWALGRAKATGLPVAVVSTSGTAAANFLPAVVEADMSLTPLLVISADRPAEMRGIGANQTIDQTDLFGNKVRFSATIEASGSELDGNDSWRSTVSKALSMASGDGVKPGPVHLNIAFREPTVPVSDDGRSKAAPYPYPIEGRSGGQPWTQSLPVEPATPSIEIPDRSRGIIIAGDGLYDRDALFEAAESVGWPVFATALSGLRGRAGVVSRYHFALAEGVPEELRPELVLAVGSVGPSQRLEQLIGAGEVRIRVDATGRTIDPLRNATEIVHADPVVLLESVQARVGDEWWATWTSVDAAVNEAVEDHLADVTYATGPGVASQINRCDWETLVVASSLPVRDVDAHLARSGSVIGNRGASGIDGFISTSLGVASSNSSVLALSGDLSFLHDMNGFLAERLDDLVLIVIDNNGGGLFDLLPQALHAPHFERLFVTPPGRRVEDVARLHDLHYVDVSTIGNLPNLVSAARVSGVSVLRVPVDRADDLEVRAALDGIGAAATRSVLI